MALRCPSRKGPRLLHDLFRGLSVAAASTPKDSEPKHWKAGIDTHLTGTRNMTQDFPEEHFKN